MTLTTETELEELLAEPYAEDVAAMRALEGDLLILGVGGKMGPSLALRATNAVRQAGTRSRIIGVSRFSSPESRRQLEEGGVETISADLLDAKQLAELPDVKNLVYMAARKFGSTGGEALTWAMNAVLPGRVAERYPDSRIVAFSSGNIYPFVPVLSGGAAETDPVGPMGEYAQSVLARERVFEFYSRLNGTRIVLLRLNYAVELRYGVLVDIGRRVFERQPIDLTMGYANVIWQGDANSVCLRSFGLCQSPPAVLNLTGPETLSVRELAKEFGRHFDVEPEFQGEEDSTALLNNAGRCHELFGMPRVSPSRMVGWIAEWIKSGGVSLNKPTHFEVRDGKF